MEFVGFIVSILSLIYLFFKQQFVVRQGEEQPDKVKKPVWKEDDWDEEDPLRELLSIKKSQPVAREPVKHLPPSPLVKQSKAPVLSSFKDYDLADQVEKRYGKNALEKRQLKAKSGPRLEDKHTRIIAPPLHHVVGEAALARPSKAKIALQRLSKRSDLIIYQEIIDKPKCMRPYP